MLTPEQEIRAKALEIKMHVMAARSSAAIIADVGWDSSGVWTDGDLEEFCDYIRDGKKP